LLKIACLGECLLELSSNGISPFSEAARLGYGGDTLNTSVYMARALAATDARVSFVTALGTDPFSDAMVAAWQGEGLDTGLVQRIEGALPGLYVIRTDPAGERSFFYWREQAAVRAMLDGPRVGRLRAALSGFDLLYLSGITVAVLREKAFPALLELVRVLAEEGVRIAFDSNHRPRLWGSGAEARSAYEALAPHVCAALPTFADETALFGDRSPESTARRWRRWGAGEVVVKNGEDACLVSSAGQETFIAGLAVDHVVDTTAAGDAFNGTFLAARLLDLPAREAAELAHAVAARVITQRGAIVPSSGPLATEGRPSPRAPC